MEIKPSPQRKVTAPKRSAMSKTPCPWKLKFSIAWEAVISAVSSLMKPHHTQLTGARKLSQISLPGIQDAISTDNGSLITPTRSPREEISIGWQELHGLHNWEGLLDPLDSRLRQEIVKYGEFAQATYDALDSDPQSKYCGSCRYNINKLFQEVGLADKGYKVTKYIYTMSQVDVPDWFEKLNIGEPWSKHSNWIGYVAVSDDEETTRIGRRDIVMAWRGTISTSEWFSDSQSKLKPMKDEEGNVKVHHGFHSIYKSEAEDSRYNKCSASDQVMKEVSRLVDLYKQKGETQISFTATGHSLGGALALLNAHDAATSLPGVFISVISFGAPRVGNMAFKLELNELGVNVLRVVNKHDLVPKVPMMILGRVLDQYNWMTRRMGWVYHHVGAELTVDTSKSPHLKRKINLEGNHNLEVYLHLVDGFLSKKSNFRPDAGRDVALVNKGSDMLIEEEGIPESWYQLPYKGLAKDENGRWVRAERLPEDVPSPSC